MEKSEVVIPGEVVPYSPPSPQAEEAALSIRGDSILTQEAIEAAERRVDAIKKIKLIALRVTSPSDWIDVSGTPYLQTSGVEKVARLFGISVVNPRMQIRRMEDEEGRLYEQYIATIRAVMNGGEIECEGIAATNDDFFARRGDKILPFSEVDIASVRKKALTNALRRGVVKLLGLGSFTWEEIHRVVSPDQVKGYEHKTGSQGGKAAAPPKGNGGGPLPKDVRGEINKMIRIMQDDLRKFTSMPATDRYQANPGVTDAAKLSDKAAPVVYHKVKKVFEQWEHENAPPPQDPREPGMEG